MAKSLRSLRGDNSLTWEKPAEYTVKYSYMHGKPVKALTITLNPTGCIWAKSGGCTMCGEFEGSTKDGSIPDYIHVAQFAKAIADLVSVYNPTWLRINQEGNYANSVETASIAQTTILKLATQIKGIKRITIESRPQYLTEAILKEYANIVSKHNIELEIGMGFEAADDVVRNVCINKGETLNDFRRAVELMTFHNIRSLAYVLLKPPFLTEKESIDVAVQSILTATEMGFKRISLEPVSIHRFTIVDALARMNYYHVPWFWSIINVVEQCKETHDLGIGGVGYFPPPLHQAHNRCNHCNTTVAKALAEYAKTRDTSVFRSLSCGCKLEWEEECYTENTSTLTERINLQLDSININDYRAQIERADTQIPTEQTLGDSIFIARDSQLQNVTIGGRS
ncbi:hypothetical protein AALA61_14280 [Oscillospiraceae bacterium 42-9]